MQLNYLTSEFAVAAQIQADDVQAVADQGFAVVICNRPDGEAADQPGFADIQAACLESGLAFHYLPMVSRGDADVHAPALKQIMLAKPGPVLAYCRSGTRSSLLWQAAQ